MTGEEGGLENTPMCVALPRPLQTLLNLRVQSLNETHQHTKAIAILEEVLFNHDYLYNPHCTVNRNVMVFL